MITYTVSRQGFDAQKGINHMANHPHKKSSLSERLRIIQGKRKKTKKVKGKKGVRVKQSKFNPFEALKILGGFGKGK